MRICTQTESLCFEADVAHLKFYQILCLSEEVTILSACEHKNALF